MPRPARKEPNIEDEQALDTQPLDGEANTVQDYRTGSVAEGEIELARSVAKRMGWTPKEEWKRDPARWVDAPEFLENTPKELESLKERNRRTAQAAADFAEEQRRQARIEAQAEIKAAAEAQDPDRALDAAKRLEKVSGPPPQTVAWMGKNPWFQEDQDAQALAVMEINRLAQTGASIEDQLIGAEQKIRRLFPNHFGQAEVQEKPADTRRQAPIPPAVQAGTRGAETRTKEKGFGDIPPGDRALYAKHFAKRYEATMTAEEAQKRYARSYWANKGEA